MKPSTYLLAYSESVLFL